MYFTKKKKKYFFVKEIYISHVKVFFVPALVMYVFQEKKKKYLH